MGLELTGEWTLPGIAAQNYWHRRHEVAYLATRPWVRGAIVLEVGTGQRYGAGILSRVARRVIAVDDDATACEHAATADPNLAVTRAGLVRLPFADHSVDAVVSLQVIQHLRDRPRFVAEAARVLRPAGALIVSAPTGELSASELTGILDPHFRVDRLYGIHHRRRLRRPGAPVTHRDFHFGEENVDASLDLFAIAIRR